MWILGLKGLKCTHPQTHLKIFLQRIFSLLASLLRAAYTNLKTGGETKMKYPSIAQSTTLVRLKLFHLHFFLFVYLLLLIFSYFAQR